MANIQDVFWLARYAANGINEILAPLYGKGLEISPNIKINFKNESSPEDYKNYISIYVHWVNSSMLYCCHVLRTTAEVDKFLTGLREKAAAYDLSHLNKETA